MHITDLERIYRASPARDISEMFVFVTIKASTVILLGLGYNWTAPQIKTNGIIKYGTIGAGLFYFYLLAEMLYGLLRSDLSYGYFPIILSLSNDLAKLLYLMIAIVFLRRIADCQAPTFWSAKWPWYKCGFWGWLGLSMPIFCLLLKLEPLLPGRSAFSHFGNFRQYIFLGIVTFLVARRSYISKNPITT